MQLLVMYSLWKRLGLGKMSLKSETMVLKTDHTNFLSLMLISLLVEVSVLLAE